MAKVDAGPGRGMRVVDGRLFSVVGSKLYQITTSGVAIPYGTVPGVGRVSMAHNQRGNGNELAIDNGSARYVYNTQTQVIQKVTDTSFPGSFKAFFADGYIGYIEPYGRYWGHSDLGNATNYQSFDVYEAEGQPDRIVSANVLMREVQIFGQETTELYVNAPSGDGAAPFQRATNTVIPYGCSARDSVANVGGTTVFLDHNRCVRPLVAGPSDPISTSVIESLLQGCTKQQIASAYSFVIEAEGFQIYYLTVPGEFTFGYDFRFREWHRRSTNGLDWWAVSDVVLWNGDWIAQDIRNGKHYKLDWHEYPFDGQDELIREWTTGAIQADQNPIFLNEVEFLFGTGGRSYEPVEFPVQPDPPSISGDAPNGTVGAGWGGYSYIGSGGTGALKFKLRSGSLPPGIGPLSAAGVVAAGTPTVAGTYTFVVRVTDANGLFADISDTITILADALVPADIEWRYLVVEKTDEADYSAVDYDDSGWGTGGSPFGDIQYHPEIGVAAHAYDARFPEEIVTTVEQADSRIWMRCTVNVPSAVTVDANLVMWIDGPYRAYVNGTEVSASDEDTGVGEGLTVGLVGIPLVAGDNVIAFRFDDFYAGGGPTNNAFYVAALVDITGVA